MEFGFSLVRSAELLPSAVAVLLEIGRRACPAGPGEEKARPRQLQLLPRYRPRPGLGRLRSCAAEICASPPIAPAGPSPGAPGPNPGHPRPEGASCDPARGGVYPADAGAQAGQGAALHPGHPRDGKRRGWARPRAGIEMRPGPGARGPERPEARPVSRPSGPGRRREGVRGAAGTSRCARAGGEEGTAAERGGGRAAQGTRAGVRRARVRGWEDPRPSGFE